MKTITILNSKIGNAIKYRYFSYEMFNLELAQGFVKFVKTNYGESFEIRVQVIDTYGLHNKKEEKKYLKEGYILMGYSSKLDIEQKEVWIDPELEQIPSNEI